MSSPEFSSSDETSLDPHDWDFDLRQFHRALDVALHRQRHIREHPVWTAPPPVRDTTLPTTGLGWEKLIGIFEQEILPYATGNTHPKFWGWVHGSGNLYGALGEALAAIMNCNVGGRNHIGTSLEKQVVGWFRHFFGFPAEASGILTSGTSMGTIIALTCARNSRAPWDVQKLGMSAGRVSMVAYASVAAHSCITKALDLLGLGRDALRLIPVDSAYRLDLAQLEAAIEADRGQGMLPFCVISTLGSVNTGSIDDVAAIAKIAVRENLWHHLDGAFGVFSICHPRHQHLVPAIASADSLAFDMHKWLHVPYDAGCVLVRDRGIHRQAFSLRPEYLRSSLDGTAGGDPWFCDYGPELSRGFRALKIWFTIQGLGFDALREAIIRNCSQAEQLAEWIRMDPRLELLAPVALNIVCFRVRPDPATSVASINDLNRRIVVALHNRGLAIPSTTELQGNLAIRICLTNHRTRLEDLRQLLDDILLLRVEIFQASGSSMGG